MYQGYIALRNTFPRSDYGHGKNVKSPVDPDLLNLCLDKATALQATGNDISLLGVIQSQDNANQSTLPCH